MEMLNDSFHVSLTGHRPEKLDGYRLDTPFYDRLRSTLQQTILDGLRRHGMLTLHSGLALGADTVWSKAILWARAQFPEQIRFVAEVPFPAQADRWPAHGDREFWQHQIDTADQVNYYAERYSVQAMHLRNQGMIKPANLLLAVYDGSSGGTGSAVRFAQQIGVRVFSWHPDQFRDDDAGEQVTNQTPVEQSETRVVHKREPHDVYIGRGSLWGNPFVIGRDGTREDVVRKYEEHFLSRPDLRAKVYLLAGKRLGCFCAPKACHGDVLKKYADEARAQARR